MILPGKDCTCSGPYNSRSTTIELTKITVHDTRWWTLALDIFGPPGEARAILSRRAEPLFSDYPGPELRSEHSYGYPQWLTSVV
jgi:hypothetical protein